MIKKLMQRLGRHRVIMDRQSNEPYLERYYVFLKDRTWFPFNIFVHKFLKSDPDHLHDHPWPYFTLILKGGYYEWVPYYDKDNNKMTEICKWRGAGHFRICKETSYHRIDLNPDITAWTLFMPGPQKREWGFMVRNKWIHNTDYLAKMAKRK
jgi:hypothetical protein